MQTDGQLKTGRDVAIAAILGADEYGFSTAPLIATGCIMMRACHLNTCPVGIATQDPELRKRFEGKPEHVVNFFFFVAEELRGIMAQLGVRTMDELIGRTELLEADDAIEHWKAARRRPHARAAPARAAGGHAAAARRAAAGRPRRRARLGADPPGRGRDRARRGRLDHDEGAQRQPLRRRPAVEPHRRGARGGGSAREHDPGRARPAPPARAFGGWLAPGVTFTLHGDANDYTGKGLSGGVVAVMPPDGVTYRAEENVIVGNTVLYGATSGRAFFRGMAGERFAVRNSGASAVVEGVGDHGCEYMTGGHVVVLGRTGRNFAAGMSGGLAFVLDEDGTLRDRVNPTMIDQLEPLTEADVDDRARPDRRAPDPDGVGRRAPRARRLGRAAPALREGVPDRLQARARRAGRAASTEDTADPGHGPELTAVSTGGEGFMTEETED